MAAREKIISIKNGSVELTPALFHPVGTTGENRSTKLIFAFDAQFEALTNKAIIFRTAGGTLKEADDLKYETVGEATICYYEIPADCFDAVGKMAFCVRGTDADGRVFETPIKDQEVQEALNPLGGTAYSTYVSILDATISARDLALTAANAADAARVGAENITGTVQGSYESAEAVRDGAFDLAETNRQSAEIIRAQFYDGFNLSLSGKATKTEVETERQRINSFTTLAAGSTTGDAELIDARVGADGLTYANAGESIRGQFGKINQAADDLNAAVFDITYSDAVKSKYSSITSMYMGAANLFVGAGVGLVIYTYAVTKGKKYHITATGYKLAGAYVGVAFSEILPVVGNGFTRIFLASATAQDINVYYDAPANGYICVSKSATGDITSVFESTTIKTSKITGIIQRPIRMQLFGDSITDNKIGDLKTWANLIAGNMPDYDIALTNSAVGGSFLRRASVGDNSVMDLVTDGTTLSVDSDIVVVFAGTNDWGSGGPVLGTFLDGTTSIYGAVQAIINYVSTHSTALLVFCTPLQRYNATDQTRATDSNGTPVNDRGYTLRQFCDAIAETCAHLGIPCIDINKISGLNRINIANFTTDGLHPNDVGDARLANIICKHIETYI